MRKGFFLVELVVVIAVITLVSVPLARLSTATFRDIPRSYRAINSNTSILNALKQIQKDVNAAKGFPKSFGAYTANNETLLIKLTDNIICYQLKDSQILKLKLANTNAGNAEEITRWPVPKAKVEWQVWRKNNKGYAVEVRTCIEQKSGDRLEKKMANSHLYFVGAYREAIN
jgi:type II secretory pathway pseudopilin PulG